MINYVFVDTFSKSFGISSMPFTLILQQLGQLNFMKYFKVTMSIFLGWIFLLGINLNLNLELKFLQHFLFKIHLFNWFSED